jgi:anaerobic selenocysteine-containing dehydrogenase
VATYFGNPSVHGSASLAGAALRKVLGSRNNYSATSLDQLPQYRVAHEVLGSLALLPVPDVDRTDHMLVLGANPAVSNGSIMTAPGIRRRLQAILDRGGRVVVVDPRRTETARLASEHVSIEPGGDVYLLLAMLNTLFADGSVRLGRLAERCDGVDELAALAANWPPERAAPMCGVDSETISRLAREFAGARRAVAYGRVGTCQQETGTLIHWLIQALNVVTGNFDEPGGAMLATPAVDLARLQDLMQGNPAWGVHRQRVSGLPGFSDELPVAGLADEILTAGRGQVRAMLIFAGNPALSTPGGSRLGEALATLEWFVAVDMYVTETSRHADVILPPVSPLERDDVDFVFPLVSVRNHVRYSPAALPRSAGGRTDWEILFELSRRIGGRVRNGALRLLGPLTTPERAFDLGLRTGPYGLRRGPRRGLTFAKVRRAVHGIDLGPLERRLPGVLRTPGKRVRLAPEPFLREARRLGELAEARAAARREGYDLVLVGRRQVPSNNSWMHNSPRLMKGSNRCTALLNPSDAAARSLRDGDRVLVSSRLGAIEVPLEVSDDMRPGVVSIPHGFGHGRDGVGWRVAAGNAGASVNDITDPTLVDRLTGTAALNAVPVRVTAASAPG